MVTHEKLGIIFPNVPYIWHYDDFANVYPTYKMEIINKPKMLSLVQNNSYAVSEINNLDDNTDYFVHAQYKNDDIFYNNKTNEIYISFHTWLYRLHTNETKIGTEKMLQEYKFNCSVYNIFGDILPSEYFPIRKIIDKKRNRIMELTSGIGINQMTKRVHSIHFAGGFNKFSPHDECNLILNPETENFAFVTIIKDPVAKTQNNSFRNPKQTTYENLGRNCVTMHIFRNKGDNNPNEKDFQKLILSL